MTISGTRTGPEEAPDGTTLPRITRRGEEERKMGVIDVRIRTTRSVPGTIETSEMTDTTETTDTLANAGNETVTSALSVGEITTPLARTTKSCWTYERWASTR